MNITCKRCDLTTTWHSWSKKCDRCGFGLFDTKKKVETKPLPPPTKEEIEEFKKDNPDMKDYIERVL